MLLFFLPAIENAQAATSYSTYYAPNSINLRASRTFDSKTIVQIPKNASFKVLDGSKDQNDWAEVTYKTYTGYMQTRYFANTNLAKTYTTYYAPSNINLRENRTFDSQTIVVIPKNASFIVEDNSEDGNNWVRIMYNQKEGYMEKRYLTLYNPSKGYGTYYAPSPINLRKSATFDSATVVQIPQNASFSVEDNSANSAGWVRIVYQNNIVGYMQQRYLSGYDPTKTYNDYYASDVVNLRSGRDFSTSVSYVVPKGQIMYALQGSTDSNGWTEFQANGRKGYMQLRYVTAKIPNATYVNYYAINNVNLRNKQDYNSPTTVTIPAGQPALVNKADIGKDWVRVVYNNIPGYTKLGYMSNGAPIQKYYYTTTYPTTFSSMLSTNMRLSPQTDKKPSKMYISSDGTSVTGTSGKVTATSVPVRTSATTTGFVTTTLKMNQTFTVLSTITDSNMKKWYQVNFSRQWFNANQTDTSYYLNPNNFGKNTASYLQFLILSEPANIDPAEVNRTVLAGKGILANKATSFQTAAQQNKVSEIYLIAHALLETGNGTSQLANGVVVSSVDGKPVTPKKVYNMYGIGAVDSAPLQKGSERAYKEGWDTPEKAIIGGAKFIGDKYINAGQNTLYKMRWNPANPGTHLYATDIAWAYKQVNTMNQIYSKLTRYTQKFDTPIYR